MSELPSRAEVSRTELIVSAELPDPRHDAFVAFVLAHQGKLARLAELLLGDLTDAEAACQDAFEELFSRWDRVDDPLAYARSILFKRRARHLQRRSRWRSMAHLVGYEAAVEGPERIGTDHEALRVALKSLTERQRRVVVLRFYLDMTEADIARELSMPAGTVKSSLNRGVAALRAHMLDFQEVER